jgi:hypothetical protein
MPIFHSCASSSCLAVSTSLTDRSGHSLCQSSVCVTCTAIRTTFLFARSLAYFAVSVFWVITRRKVV